MKTNHICIYLLGHVDEMEQHTPVMEDIRKELS